MTLKMSFEGVITEKLIAFLRQLSSWFYKTQFKLLMAFERSPSNFWPLNRCTTLNNNTAATHGETWTKKKFEYPATIFSHDNPLLLLNVWTKLNLLSCKFNIFISHNLHRHCKRCWRHTHGKHEEYLCGITHPGTCFKSGGWKIQFRLTSFVCLFCLGVE